MMCIISGLETHSLYKNQPIHPDVMSMARDLMKDEGMSMSQALKHISYILVMGIKQKLQEGETPLVTDGHSRMATSEELSFKYNTGETQHE